MKKKQEFEPGQMVEAVQPCAMDVDGISYVFNPGKRVSSDHPAVKSNPTMFQTLEGDRAERSREQS